MRFEDDVTHLLNPISALPTSKEKIKKSIIERINLLVVSYTSLATFIPDETLTEIKKTSRKEVYLDVLADMEKLKEELWERLK